ncbi:hypothetical protein JCM4814A_47260 [Streptomyces phaeofaciens JCM 4814]|uniref:Secreted protein n=1 Tax=Streptomyces phaeofaciens TaxID=68254 RepID=A0A918H296_9ACTN|nr:hypothetical protein [Streptomyces phaeofaciens]GGT31155.1 hypothetical protein GCM10010226_03930 [Streptomyces phaeofaciens]
MSRPGLRLRTATTLAAALLGAAAPPATAGGGLITVIDNSHADSVLEVDRAANIQQGSSGTAGSDHEGSAVDLMEALVAGPAAHDGD